LPNFVTERITELRPSGGINGCTFVTFSKSETATGPAPLRRPARVTQNIILGLI
jgi:hypothetical protein